jgi:antitoxin (DNA-binding transcriptional repressor) of toxin-antitoxin stability system
MELRVSNKEAAASLDALLDRVSGRGDTVVIERDGRPIGKLVPTQAAVPGASAANGSGTTMRDLVRLVHSFPSVDDGWADGVEQAVRAGNWPLPPESPWDC